MPTLKELARQHKALATQLAQKHRDAGRLRARIERGRKQLARLEARLKAIVGTETTPTTPAGRKPAKKAAAPAPPAAKAGPTQKPLYQAIADVLKAAAKPMKAAEVCKQVIASGYRSKSKNLQKLVVTRLYHG